MDYGIANIFSRLLERHGAGIAIFCVAAVVIIFVLMKYALARIEAGRRAEDHALSLQVQLNQQAAAKEAAFLGEIKAGREQNLKIMENHLEHDRQEREAVVAALSQMNATQTELVSLIKQLAAESRQRDSDLEDSVAEMRIDIARRSQ